MQATRIIQKTLVFALLCNSVFAQAAPTTAPATAPATQPSILQPTLVSLSVTDSTIQQAVAKLNEVAHFDKLKSRPTVPSVPKELYSYKANNRPYMEVLLELAKLGELRPYPQAQSLMFLRSTSLDCLSGQQVYYGPFAVLCYMTTTTTKLSCEPNAVPNRTVSVPLMLLGEPHITMVGTRRIEISQAIDNTGQPLTFDASDSSQAESSLASQYIRPELFANFIDVPASATEIQSMKGNVIVSYVANTTEYRFGDILNRKPNDIIEDRGVKMRILSVDTHTIGSEVKVEFLADDPDLNKELVQRSGSIQNTFRQMQLFPSGSTKAMEHTIRISQAETNSPIGLLVRWKREAGMNSDDDADSLPKIDAVLNLPTRNAEFAIPFEFRNLPLP